VSTPDLSDAFEIRYGIPQPKWVQVLDALGDDPIQWEPFLREWSNHAAVAFGSNGLVYRTERAIIVTDLAEKDAERTVRVVRSAVDLIEHLCLPSDHQDRRWPRLFFVVEDEERYYDFAAGGIEAVEALQESDATSHEQASFEDAQPAEEIASAGMCFQDGYVHILAGYRRNDYFATTIAHEFTHAVNASRQLPLWLDEGLAEVMAARFMYGKRYQDNFVLDRLQWRDTVGVWKRNGFDSLWSGEAFRDLDLSYAAYDLVPRLTINLLERCGEAGFRALLESGPWEDQGDSAIQSVTGQSLSDFANAMIRD